MALRNQPYFPLYVQDFLTDEKLAECNAESTGVYIRLMCLLHKSETYGSILLKQKDKQNSSTCLNFAYKLARQMPYDVDTINRSLEQLIEENVLTLEGNKLYQKRMVNDGELSEKRAKAGAKGGKKTSKKNSDFASCFASKFALAKSQANTENEIEYENEKENEIINEYINSINPNMSSMEYEKLIKYIEIFKNDIRVIKYGIEYCKYYQVFNINYLCKILDNWKEQNLFTLEEIKANERKFKSKKKKNKEQLFEYDWLEEDIEESS